MFYGSNVLDGWVDRLRFSIHHGGATCQWSGSLDSAWRPAITSVGRGCAVAGELPQLLNVLNGEMSLIGPRPERPELEHELERHIPHYRKRYWMRPGHGWAQVAPLCKQHRGLHLKLSYDLYYLRHFSTWLDLLMLFRTIKMC